MSKYEMVIHVESADDMALIVQACKGTAQLISSKLLEVRRSPRRKMLALPPPVRHRTTLTGADLMRKIFADGHQHSTAELSDAFVAAGFAPKSASPALSILNKAGEVKQLNLGSYIKTSKLQALNSGGPAS